MHPVLQQYDPGMWNTDRRKHHKIPVAGDKRSSPRCRESQLLLISDGASCSANFGSGERIDSASSKLLGYDGRKMLVQEVA